MIAMALVPEPRLVIADEPTTALDVRVQEQVLDLLLDLAAERELALILITHDLSVLAGVAERVVVMYGGRVMETAPTDEIFYRALHPYTVGLLESIPRIDSDTSQDLVTIGGSPPAPDRPIPGCPFHPRCRFAEDLCAQQLPRLVTPTGGNHPAACHLVAGLIGPRDDPND